MASSGDTDERRRARLDELADLGMALARDLQARALAAADDKAACDLSLAFHRISRSIRQTMALDARLERDLKREAHEAAKAWRARTLERVQRRRREVADALAPLLWTEAEGDEDEYDALSGALGERLMAYGPEDEEFADQPLDVCVETIRKAFGLPAADIAAQSADAAAPLQRSSG